MANPAVETSERTISFGPFRLSRRNGSAGRRQAGSSRQPRSRYPDRLGRAPGRGGRQGRADGPRLARHLCRGGQSQVPGQRVAPDAWATATGIWSISPGAATALSRRSALAEDARQPSAARSRREAAHNLPAQLTRLIGRADTVSRLAEQLPQQRLLTIVGPGGIGKTSVALAVAEALIPAYEHGVWLIDLAPLGDPRLVPSALAAALGLEIRSEDPLPGLIAVLRDKKMLLVLDNCEHVIDAAAALAVQDPQGAPAACTSSQPAASRCASRASTCTAFRRWRARPHRPRSPRPKRSASRRFSCLSSARRRLWTSSSLSDADAPIVADICRKLDGIRAGDRVGGRPRRCFRGARGRGTPRRSLSAADERPARRLSPPRHRTLRATLDWSYRAAHRGRARRSASPGDLRRRLHRSTRREAVTSDGEAAGSDVVAIVADLVTKSLAMADVGDASVSVSVARNDPRLCLEKLDERGEREPMMRSYAVYHRDLLERAKARPLRDRPPNGWPRTATASTICAWRSIGLFRQWRRIDRCGARGGSDPSLARPLAIERMSRLGR